MNPAVCQHGSLKRQCNVCDMGIECIRLQQEINCLRMEPCQLDHCVKDRAKIIALLREAREWIDPSPAWTWSEPYRDFRRRLDEALDEKEDR